jgi:hypothetical protein
VTQYGAVGDGKTDNYQAIQRALAAAPNGTLYFPTGTYLTSGPIVLYSQSANGAGASSVIVGTFMDNAFTSGVFVPQGSCTISNLSINLAGAGLGANQGVLVKNTQGPVTINQVQMVGNFDHNVMVFGAGNVTVSNCTLANTSQNQFGPDVILLCNSSTVLIANNTFTPATQFTGAFLDSFPLGPMSSKTATTNVTISGNSFQGGTFYGNFITATYLSGLNITGNTFSSPQYQGPQNSYQGSPAAIILNGTAPLSTGPVTNVQINNNNFVNIQPTSYPIGNYGVVTITGQGQTPNVQNVVVNGNVFSQYAVPGWNCSLSIGVAITGDPGSIQNFSATGNIMTGTCYAGFWIDSTRNIAIQNNTLSNCYGSGIYTGTGDSGSLTISNNALTNCGLAPPSSPVVTNLGLSLLGSIIVNAASNITGAAITGNSYGTATEANNLQYDIYCALSKSITNESGNTDQTLLANYGPI